MKRHPLFGVLLAAFGALVLTPDAMFLRLSGMGGAQMFAWRGLLMGSIFLVLWLATSSNRRRDMAALGTGAGLAIIGCQYFNAVLFATGIASAPAAVVLFGLATVPIFAALLARVIIGEATHRVTWITIVVVIIGIGIAVFSGHEGGVALNWKALFGAAFGLGVALVLAMNFVVLRARPNLPILLAIGLGALLAGFTGLTLIGPAAMLDGEVWAVAITGAIILPITFFTLSLASRYTHASNVSLLLLLETVLGPVWVWWGVGEAPTIGMIVGGAIVVSSIGIYLIYMARKTSSNRL